MKYYSEILNKTFNTDVECLEAEKAYEDAKAKAAEVKAASEAKASKRKKELANAVEKATEELETAELNLEAAKEQVKILLEESNKKMVDILNPAKEAVRKANQAKYVAISNFNKEFGAYTTTISNESLNKHYKNNLFDFFDLFKYLSI